MTSNLQIFNANVVLMLKIFDTPISLLAESEVLCCVVVDGEALDIVVVVVGCVGVDDEEDVSVVVDNIVAGKVVGVKDDD